MVRLFVLMAMGTIVVGLSACEKSPPESARKVATVDPAPSSVKPPQGAVADLGGRDRSDPTITDGRAESRPLVLTGLTMLVPPAWVAQNVTPSPMSPKAVFRLKRDELDTGDSASVRVMHFPSMKGMDDANIDRWLGKVRRDDGTPSTRSDATVSKIEAGEIRITIVDVSGTLTSSRGGTGSGVAGQRMIAAIIDHPNGPHFVKATGPAEEMALWVQSIQDFIKSAKVTPLGH